MASAPEDPSSPDDADDADDAHPRVMVVRPQRPRQSRVGVLEMPDAEDGRPRPRERSRPRCGSCSRSRGAETHVWRRRRALRPSSGAEPRRVARADGAPAVVSRRPGLRATAAALDCPDWRRKTAWASWASRRWAGEERRRSGRPRTGARRARRGKSSSERRGRRGAHGRGRRGRRPWRGRGAGRRGPPRGTAG